VGITHINIITKNCEKKCPEHLERLPENRISMNQRVKDTKVVQQKDRRNSFFSYNWNRLEA
jgi:hypothetical protein